MKNIKTILSYIIGIPILWGLIGISGLISASPILFFLVMTTIISVVGILRLWLNRKKILADWKKRREWKERYRKRKKV